MLQLYNIVLEAAVASAVLIPLFLCLNRFRFHSIRNTIVYTLFAIYLAGIYAVAGLPNICNIGFEPNINVIPFQGMFSQLRGTVLNILLFIPMGVFPTVLCQHYRTVHHTVFLGFISSFGIELLQILTFRATDINDLITNTLGTFVGWILARIAIHVCPKLSSDAPTADLGIVFFSSGCIMFFLQPLIWALIY